MDELERGREAYRRRAWLTAYKALSLADEAAPLEAEDLELLATSAYLIGRNDDGVCALDRAHHGYLDAGEPVCAARCAVWLGFGLIDAGEMSRATAAEDAYRSASQWGWQPQPGLALLRLAQGRTDAAAAGICRVVGETTERLERSRLLPAHVEIMLAAGETAQARDACRELAEIAEGHGRDGVLGATACWARRRVGRDGVLGATACWARRPRTPGGPSSWRQL